MPRRAPSDFSRIFNLRDEKGVGRSMILLSNFFLGIANIFITGTFYTGFLSDNGIDIVSVGIITFIPYFSWIFGLFGPKILSHFKKRRGLLIFNHTFYYGFTVLATTIMPRFVTDPGARTVWFGIFLFLANLCNALLGASATPWQRNFLPDGDDRNIYFSATYLVTNLTGTFSALGAALLTDALAGSPYQSQVLIILRYVSFVLFMLAGVATLIVPKEYPYDIAPHYRLQDVLLKPARDKRFLLTILITVIWNAVGSFNAGTWAFYLLNTVEMPYLMTYVSTFVCAIGGIFLLPLWRRAIRRYNWLKVIWVNVFIAAWVEFALLFTTARTLPLYVIVAVISGINLIGAQLNFANVFYYNLPMVDSDLYVSFYNFTLYVCMFLGSMFGTWVLSFLETFSHRFLLFGLPMSGSQLLLVFKAAGFFAMCWYLYRVTPRIIHPEDVRTR